MDETAFLASADALLDASAPPVTTLANASALLYGTLEGVNWAGFYLLRDGVLWLGPFQGKPACQRIPLGKGVCGAAFEKNETLLVPDVHKFPGHIACDVSSRSEIVTPLRGQDGKPFGVLDLDSPFVNRFTRQDARLLESFASLVAERCGTQPCF